MHLHSTTPNTARRDMRRADSDFRATALRGELRQRVRRADDRKRRSGFLIYTLPLAVLLIGAAVVAVLP